LLWDGVRVLTRLVGKIQALLPEQALPFVNHTRRARRRMQEIHRLTPKQRQEQQVPKYRHLITLTTEVLAAARAVAAAARAASGPDPLTGIQVDALATAITTYGERIDRVIDQARRRVLQGETVATADKLFSIFEPHTDLIKRGKAQRPVEFGHKVLLSESGHGLITDYRILEGNPPDDRHVAPSLEHHIALFGGPPTLAAHDRGFYSLAAIQACQAAGVTTECIPQRGAARRRSGRRMRRAARFAAANAFAPALKGESRCCSAGEG
jgi:IS5 family transposase